MHTQSRNSLTDIEIRLVVGRGKRNEWARSSGLGRGKLTFRMNKQQGPTDNTGNYIQHPVINHNKENEKECTAEMNTTL